ncbi:hypothetical protein ACQPYK_49685 (plasmid) [Streptosporangium sp. CA-135522]|uniref:hypothetical protein n=1 Tax=Streptosporangium sp. CA-135522 TaxID=3240072 RepID=UPI003D94A8A7
MRAGHAPGLPVLIDPAASPAFSPLFRNGRKHMHKATLPATKWLMTLLQTREDARHTANRSEDNDLQEKLRDANTNVVNEVIALLGFRSKQDQLRAADQCPAVLDADKCVDPSCCGISTYCGQPKSDECGAGCCPSHHNGDDGDGCLIC